MSTAGSSFFDCLNEKFWLYFTNSSQHREEHQFINRSEGTLVDLFILVIKGLFSLLKEKSLVTILNFDQVLRKNALSLSTLSTSSFPNEKLCCFHWFKKYSKLNLSLFSFFVYQALTH